MGTLHNGVAAHFQVTPLFSMKVELLASSQSCHRVDALEILHWRVLRRVRHPTPLSWYKHFIYMRFSGKNWWNCGMALPSGKSWKLHFTAQVTKVILLSSIFIIDLQCYTTAPCWPTSPLTTLCHCPSVLSFWVNEMTCLA